MCTTQSFYQSCPGRSPRHFYHYTESRRAAPSLLRSRSFCDPGSPPQLSLLLWAALHKLPALPKTACTARSLREGRPCECCAWRSMHIQLNAHAYLPLSLPLSQRPTSVRLRRFEVSSRFAFGCCVLECNPTSYVCKIMKQKTVYLWRVQFKVCRSVWFKLCDSKCKTRNPFCSCDSYIYTHTHRHSRPHIHVRHATLEPDTDTERASSCQEFARGPALCDVSRQVGR